MTDKKITVEDSVNKLEWLRDRSKIVFGSVSPQHVTEIIQFIQDQQAKLDEMDAWQLNRFKDFRKTIKDQQAEIERLDLRVKELSSTCETCLDTGKYGPDEDRENCPSCGKSTDL